MAGAAEGAPPGRPGPTVTSFYVWGSDRTEVNAAARRIAARLDREYAWVEVSERTNASESVRSETEPDRGVARAEDLPRTIVSEERLRSYVRPTDPHDPGRDLLEFLRLWDPVQEAITALLARTGPRVLVLSNWDLQPAPPGGDHVSWGGLIEFLHRHGITLVATTGGRTLPDRIDFEYSIATSDVLPQQFQTIAAVCQWGNCDDCLVNQLFPRDEVVCLNRLLPGRPGEAPGGLLPNELLLN